MKYFHQCKITSGEIVPYGWQYPAQDLKYKNSHNYLQWYNRNFCYENFNNEFLKKIETYAPLEGITFFLKPYFSIQPIHTDGAEKMCGLNIVIAPGSLGKMRWFEPKYGIKKQTKLTIAGTPYEDWDISEVNLVEEHNMTNHLTLVKVNIPHQVVVESIPRICISFRIKEKNKSWEETVQDFIELGI